MSKSNQQRDDPNHFDGVFIGAPVPHSVFFRGLRRDRCVAFKRTHEIAAEQEALDRRESKRKERERKKRYRDKGKQS